MAIHTYTEWSKDSTLRLGAGIAYYGIIAIVPLLLVAVGIAEIFFTSAEINAFLEGFVQYLFGDQATEIIPEIEEVSTAEPIEGVFNVGLVGAGALFFSATLIFIALQDALNVIWKTYKGFVFSIKRYVISFGVMLITGAAMTAILATHAVLNYARHLLPEDVEIISFFTGLISVVAVFCIITITILLLLKSFITVKLSTKDLLLSSGIISAFMYAGVYGLAIYFSNFANKSLYGALAGLILLLVAIYYFSQIFLAGAQLSKVIAYRNGNKHLQKHLKTTDPR